MYACAAQTNCQSAEWPDEDRLKFRRLQGKIHKRFIEMHSVLHATAMPI